MTKTKDLDQILYSYEPQSSLKEFAEAKVGIRSLLLELIGKDEEYPTGNEIVECDLNMTEEMYRIDAQNILRAELREKVKEL